MRGWWAGLAALVCVHVAHADGLSADEISALDAGHTIVRPQTFDQTNFDSDRRLIGGLAYTLVDTTPDELLSILDDTSKWQYLLPRTKSATVVEARGLDTWVELAQGTGVLSAKNTLHLRRSPNDHTVRFWLDPSKPHAIDDAWGFFRAEPAAPSKEGTPRTLLTFGVLVDTGPGIVRTFYEERLRAAMLDIPRMVHEYVLNRSRKKYVPT